MNLMEANKLLSVRNTVAQIDRSVNKFEKKLDVSN